MFKTYHLVIIYATLCLIIKGIGGKIRNYGNGWLSSIIANMHMAGFDL